MPIYRWNVIPQNPVVHIYNLKLVGIFKEILLKENNLVNKYHDIFDYNSIDQLSILATVTRRFQYFHLKTPLGIRSKILPYLIMQWIG